MTGHGGWPMTVFLTPDGRPFFGGTYFPKAAARRHARLHRAAARRIDERGATAASELRRAGRPSSPRPSAARRDARPGAAEPARRRDAHRGARRACGAQLDHAVGRLRRRAQVPPDDEPRPAAAGPRAHRSTGARHRAPRRSTPWPPAASTTTSAAGSPATRSTRSGSSRTSRRCSTTRPCSPASTCTPGRSPARPATARSSTRRSTTCCATCATPAAASTRPRTPTPKAIGGQVLRLDARRGPRRSLGADADAAIEWWGVTAGRQLRGHEHPRPAPVARRPAPARRRRARPGGAVRRPRDAGPARPRRQGADRVERR